MATTEKERIDRINELSRPKPVPEGFLDDRRSLYWDRYDNIVKDWNGGNVATVFAMTPRLDTMIQPKGWHRDFVGDRPSPIWVVSKQARNATATARVESLSEAKAVHKDFRPEKSVYTEISEAAKNAEASQRVDILARSKTYNELPIKPNSSWDWGEWESDIPEAAKKSEASERVQLLARPKSLHPRYQECRSVSWAVSEQAKKTLPSLRIQKLARPKSRSQYQEDYNPNWFKVSPSARVAHANPRLSELSTPIPRKVRQKKVLTSKGA
ncbi:sperm microtubule associated protein 2-like [Rhopilema esculentum]|uniref:sperm microtubule associated protein 2-like n=1 Tax=Rhopilema esculentum TaxID=499914 RepID=UPI0031DD63EE|eukprot:gene8063-13978_t